MLGYPFAKEIMKLITVTALLSCSGTGLTPTAAFSPAVTMVRRTASKTIQHRPSLVASLSKDPVEDATTSMLSTLTRTHDPSTTSDQSLTLLERQTMDEAVFRLNKIMIDSVYNILCFLYPIRGTKRDFARFFVLETVARVPYFAYLSVLHLRETFGEREHPDRMRTHYAQADNEYHHLLIMEDLGGNDEWIDRITAQSMAFVYYWYVIAIYLWYPPAAYHLSELIEDHAYNTYNNFLNEYAEKLQSMAVPAIARKYYELDNPFLFDLFCCVKEDGVDTISNRRPRLENLYDVFVNIRDDESEHWKTLCNLVQYDDMNAVPANQVQSTKPATSNDTVS